MSTAKSAFVTGATGFIGRPIVRALTSEGWRVAVGVRPHSNSPVPADTVGTVSMDLNDSAPIVLPAGIDTVFHLAGKAHALAEISQDDAEYNCVNVEGTRRLLEAAAAASVRSFVYFSSIKAAAAPAAAATAPLAEDFTMPPETAYGRSKREAERLVLEGNYVPHPVVLRPTLVYGPGAKGNLQKMAIAVRAGRFPPLAESGNRRSMVHVEDVCRAAIAVALHPAAAGRTYILSDGVPVSTRQLFVWMCAAVGRPVPRWTVPTVVLRVLARIGDGLGRIRGRRFVFDSYALTRLTDSAWYSSAVIERELDWRPRHTLRDSLPEIVATATDVDSEPSA